MGLSPILIVEDTDFSRLMLERQVQQLGYQSIAVKDGLEAWEVLQNEPINFIITDWMMPRLDGIRLCERVRGANLARYVYIILLTTKGDKSDLITGIEAGADDFMVKPFNPMELKVKIFAGERVLNYEKTLVSRNEELHKANVELSRTYGVIQENLKLAADFQEALLPEKTSLVDGILFESLFVPCEFVAGDIFNFFKLDDNGVVFYLLDVAGHGVAAAMLSFTLSHLIMPMPFGARGMEQPHEPDFLNLNDPVKLARDLNNMFLDRSDDQQYFTMIYGMIDLRRKRVRFTRAGHPPLVYLPAGGEAVSMGKGGLPMGLFPDIELEVEELDYRPGDRIFVYSDGVTECKNSEGARYSLDGLQARITQSRTASLSQTIQRIYQDLRNWKQSSKFEDDISILAIEFPKD